MFATGISNGGFMAHRVGCELADRVAAIAPVAGTLSEELVEVCDPVAPVAVMLRQRGARRQRRDVAPVRVAQYA